ncbi:restriction endonuclease subunit S [Aliarcobacter butzleri]|uniref:restriction endonuclease subunit S n=1 Tax=Aliarcobacter butzleri TaxID=28197 RepID=UPI0021B509E2|nr:restriction endonuclease subunit S [Aliarcobacter butzleri]MCT7564825.1 restriction endonuclease subunit S [Aliarcobacter butzleri]
MIDNLPNGWKIKELKNVGEFIRGVSYNKNDLIDNIEEDTDITLLRANNIQDRLFLNDFQFLKNKSVKQKQLIKYGDILIAMSSGSKDLVGKNVFINKDLKNYSFGAFCSVFRTNEKNNKKYIAHFFKSKIFKNSLSLNGTNINNLRITEMELLNIPIPPLQQQEKIVKVLDLTSNLIEKQKKLLEKYDLFLKSKFIEMFGDPITNPMGWEVVKCIDVADCIVPGRDKPKSFTGNIPWITTSDLKDKGIIFKSKENIGLSQIEINEVKAKLIPKNSVIFTCVGELGLCSITNENIIMNQQLHSFQCRDKINNIFLMFDISMQKSYMYKMATSTTVPYMNKTTCNNIPTILPPIELQNKFASIVKKIETIKEKENQKLKQFEDLHNSMMNKAFKGEIK